MTKCANCGRDVQPGRPQVHFGFTTIFLVLLFGVFYFLWWISRPEDRCPVCGKSVYLREGTASQAIYCTKCGKPLTTGSIFCTHCGGQADSTSLSQPHRKSNTGKNIIIGLLAAFLLLVVITAMVGALFGEGG